MVFGTVPFPVSVLTSEAIAESVLVCGQSGCEAK